MMTTFRESLGLEVDDATYRAVDESVYLAEATVRDEAICDEWPDELRMLAPDEVRPYMEQVLQATGYDPTLPQVRLDLSGDDMAEGQCGVAGDLIRLNPRRLDRCIILHELAHLCRWNDGHGAQFRGVLVALYEHGLNFHAAQELAIAFQDAGLEIDREWAWTSNCTIDFTDEYLRPLGYRW